MKIHIDTSALKRTTWHEYALRFLAGGVITGVTGIIAKKFGPGVGGLFLAFPAIFPASATLIEKHEKRKKERAGFDGTKRGRIAAGLDAAGAAMGTGGLLIFALVAWKGMLSYPAWAVLVAASLGWLGVSALIWFLCDKVRAIRG